MKLFFAYLHTRRRTLAAFVLFAALFLLSFLLCRLPLGAVVYPAVLCLLFGAVFLLADFLRVRRTHETLSQIRRMTAAMEEVLPPPEGILDGDYQGVIRGLLDESARTAAAANLKYEGMVDYYTVWAHQIKTPIAAMKLTLQQEDTPLSRRLSADLFRIEQYVEMVLAFLRLDAPSTDYVFREVRLDDLLRPCLRKFAPEFIGRHLRLTYAPIAETVLTDEKWLSFVIEQIISNALKYTREGGIHIYLEKPKTLRVSDTGMGIAPEDLPRIFEQGFTGRNGRADQSATGLGLYLCQRICQNLGCKLSATSEVGKGTTLSLDLSRRELTVE